MKSVPPVLELQASYACEQSCSFCSVSAELERWSASPLTPREIAAALASARARGADRVDFAGAGEPTAHPNLPAALRAARSAGLRTRLVSNGQRLSEAAYARSVLPFLDELVLSLHGDGAALHDGLTRRAGSFEKLLRAFERARPATKLATNTVVTAANASRVVEILRLAARQGARRCQFSQLVPSGRGARGYAERAARFGWWRSVLPRLSAAAREEGVELRLDGLPLCATGGRQALLKNESLGASISVDRVAGGGGASVAVTHNADPGDRRRLLKPPPCAVCADAPRCDGVRAEYLRAFGDAELRPVRRAAPAPAIGATAGGDPAGWRNFYADQDFEDVARHPDWALGGTLVAEYSDRECFYTEPAHQRRKWRFLDYPFEKPLRHGLGRGESPASLAFELEERDAVLGTQARRDELLRGLPSRAKGAAHVLVARPCLPLVLGDDLDGFARDCGAACGAAPVPVSMNDREQDGALARELRLAYRGRSGSPDQDAVNVFRFPRPFLEGELQEWLGAVGLRLNLAVLPAVDLSRLREAPGAALNVFCAPAGELVDPLRAELEEEGERVALAVPPYGLEGTRRCLEAIARAAGREERLARAWEARLAAHARELAQASVRARGRRVAFVCDAALYPRLLGARYGSGPAPLPLALEMGFGVVLLWHAGAGAPPKEVPAGAEISVFLTPRELAARLREGRFSAVYSDIRFDERISGAGKARFAAAFFEPGLEGHRRGLRRLLAACESPFYARYGAAPGRAA